MVYRIVLFLFLFIYLFILSRPFAVAGDGTVAPSKPFGAGTIKQGVVKFIIIIIIIIIFIIIIIIIICISDIYLVLIWRSVGRAEI